MEYRILGDSGLKVSRLCFGSLTVGPLQAGLDLKEGVSVIRTAFDMGVNFIDTAELYRTYDYIKKAVEGRRKDIIIATKCYAYTKKMAEESLDKALKELNTDYIDIFLLHEQESEYTIKGHYEAIEYFLKAKEKGKIRAFGISTHRIEGVLGAIKYDEAEIIHPIINKYGIGIQDGSVEEMLDMIKRANSISKGIYGMKPLGGGHLISKAEECFNFVREIPYIHSIAIGMQSRDEIDANVNLMEYGYIPDEIKEKLEKKKRKLIVADYCMGCGNCVKTCKNGGIEIIDGKAVPNENCIFCGYCAKSCPEFCIKVI